MRTAGCRGLGCLVRHAPLAPAVAAAAIAREIGEFALRRLAEEHAGPVRVRCSWTVSNLCAAIDAVAAEGGRSLLDGESSWLHSLCEATLAMMVRHSTGHPAATRALRPGCGRQADNDKVVCNATRALGCLAPVWPFDAAAGGPSEMSEQLVEALLAAASSGSAKVAWNTCYALGKCLRSASFLKTISAMSHGQIFDTLQQSILFSPNYKVRISAATTLTMPEDLAGYSGRLPEALATVCEAAEMLSVSVMETRLGSGGGLSPVGAGRGRPSDFMVGNRSAQEDLANAKHRQTLKAQLHVTITHLLRLATAGVPDDDAEGQAIYIRMLLPLTRIRFVARCAAHPLWAGARKCRCELCVGAGCSASTSTRRRSRRMRSPTRSTRRCARSAACVLPVACGGVTVPASALGSDGPVGLAWLLFQIAGG